MKPALAVGYYLRLDPLTALDQVERLWKILERQGGCEHRFCIERAAAQQLDRRFKRMQDGHRAQRGDLLIVNAERREGNPGLAGRNAEYHKLSAALDRGKGPFNGPCDACDINHAIESERLIFKQFVDIGVYRVNPKFLCTLQALRMSPHEG